MTTRTYVHRQDLPVSKQLFINPKSIRWQIKALNQRDYTNTPNNFAIKQIYEYNELVKIHFILFGLNENSVGRKR